MWKLSWVLRSLRSLRDGEPESHKASLYMYVFYMLFKTHRNTQVCFVSSACGVTVSYRLIKPIHHFTQRRLSQQSSSWRTQPAQNVDWNNQHSLIFPFILSWFGWTFLTSLYKLLSYMTLSETTVFPQFEASQGFTDTWMSIWMCWSV